METAIQNQEQQALPVEDVMPVPTEIVGSITAGDTRKKYHSSAMYAASKWHGTVNHVKPTHGRLDL